MGEGRFTRKCPKTTGEVKAMRTLRFYPMTTPRVFTRKSKGAVAKVQTVREDPQTNGQQTSQEATVDLSQEARARQLSMSLDRRTSRPAHEAASGEAAAAKQDAVSQVGSPRRMLRYQTCFEPLKGALRTSQCLVCAMCEQILHLIIATCTCHMKFTAYIYLYYIIWRKRRRNMIGWR
jgi:hypothetical protein